MSVFGGMAATSSLRQWSDRAQLLHDRVEVCHAPVLADLTVDDAHCIDGLEADFGACASDAEKIPSMRAVISLECGDHVAVDPLPMNLRREIREGFTQALVEGENAGFVASATGLGRMIDEIVRKEFVEQGPISSALHLFGVAANDLLGGLADVSSH